MYKSKLQEYCQKNAWKLPEYSTTREGFDHCPMFKATVVVNGSTFSTPDFSKSSKDAQNTVAQIAFHKLTGCSSANNTLTKTNETMQAVAVSGANSLIMDDKRFKEMAHIYKNQLQIYAQRRNLLMPTYSCEREGPPHACRFRSKVTLEEKTYECTEYFNTVKDAENAAAKIALMELSPDGIQEEDSGVYKNLLQELAQKEYSRLPEYNTTWSGTSHMPMFVSTVEINDVSFTGQEAKTKKMAEMNAAKVAYTALKGNQMKQKSEQPFSRGPYIKDASHPSASKLQPIIKAETSLGNSTDPNLSCNKGAHQKAGESKPITTSFSVGLENCGEESQYSQNVAVVCPPPILEQKTKVEFDSSQYSQNVAVVCPPPLLDQKTKVEFEPWDASSNQKKVRVYPWMSNMTYPPDTAILHKDENWVAVTPQTQSRPMNYKKMLESKE